MFHTPNIYRNKVHNRLGTDDSAGNNGYFIIPHNKIINQRMYVIASDGLGWEHVSVSIGSVGMEPKRIPTWYEMCYIKSLFWDEEDAVVQIHPPKSEYINMHEHVLHLWRKCDTDWETPPKILVGV